MLQQAKEQIEKAHHHLLGEFAKLQLGRATPSLVEDIRIDSYGTLQPMKNIANIVLMDTQTLSIQPWDKSSLHSIAKAITDAGTGLNPQTMADSVMIKIPTLTEERRKEVAKYAKTLVEEAKISIRNIRGEYVKKMKKMETDKEISEDQLRDMEADLQKIIEDANKNVDISFKSKEQDIMKI